MANFFNVSNKLSQNLTNEGCEIHVIINQGAATRRNKVNTFAGFSYNGDLFYKPCVNFDKGNTVPFVESFSTKYKAKDGKGKSNPYKDGEGDLKNEIESISKKVKIDDIIYVGHSGTGYVFFEYGSHTKINDAWQIDPASGRRSGQASSLRPDFYDPLTMAKKVDFNQGSGPRLYHLGCFGATGSGATQSFRNAAITNWGVKVRSCLGRTNYAKDKTEVFLIPCDDKNVNIIIPESSDLKAGYTWQYKILKLDQL